MLSIYERQEVKIEEVWKNIDEYHVCSNMGRVKTVKIQRGHPSEYVFKTNKPTAKGYIRIKIGKKGIMLHRLVAQLFVENDNPLEKKEINHKNGIRHDNRAENLEWVSHIENIRHSVYTLGTKWGKGAEKRKIKIKNKTTGEIYNSYTEAAQILNVRNSTISNAIKRNCKVRGNILISLKDK